MLCCLKAMLMSPIGCYLEFSQFLMKKEKRVQLSWSVTTSHGFLFIMSIPWYWKSCCMSVWKVLDSHLQTLDDEILQRKHTIRDSWTAIPQRKCCVIHCLSAFKSHQVFKALHGTVVVKICFAADSWNYFHMNYRVLRSLHFLTLSFEMSR